MHTFGEILKNLREQRGLTQQQFADLINIGRSSVAQYETNRKMPDSEGLKKIADYFDVSIDFLLGRMNKVVKESNESLSHKPVNINTDRLPAALKRLLERIIKLSPDKIKVLESVLDTWVESGFNNTSDNAKEKTNISYSTSEILNVADVSVLYNKNPLSQIITKEYDIDYISFLLENEIIVLTDKELNPLSPGLKKGFISYLRNYNHPEMFEQTDISEDDPTAAHRQGHLRLSHDNIKPEFMAMRRVVYRLNKILKKYLSQINSKKI